MTVYEGQWHLLDKQPEIVLEWGWQDEICPATKRPHKQGYIRTDQVRKSALIRLLPGIRIMKKYKGATWDQLVEYCKKSKTAVPNTQVHVVNDAPTPNMERALTMIAKETLKYRAPKEIIDKGPKDVLKHRYWKGVCVILRTHPEWVNIFSSPLIMTAWMNTYDVWVEIATCQALASRQPQNQHNEITECKHGNECVGCENCCPLSINNGEDEASSEEEQSP